MPQADSASTTQRAFLRLATVNGVAIGASIHKLPDPRVMRTRPIFRSWSCAVDIDFLPDQINQRDIVEFVEVAGRIIGLCDWRPKFGRFEIER